MNDDLLTVATNAIGIIRHLGRNDLAVALESRINRIMGWNQ